MTGPAITLVLMRHGVAEAHDARPTDAERALTPEGLEAAGRAARGLVALGVRPDVVVTSPLIRCRQTAELVAGAAACPLHADMRLAPGMTSDDVLDVVLEHPDARTILLCTHQPGLTYAVADLTGCAPVDFKRPGAAVLRIERPAPGGASLAAVLPPRILRAAAER